MEAVRCENLTKRYERITALDSLSLSVDERCVFGFLGPNGAGKTTTVKLLLGLSQPTSGKAWVAGEEVTTGAIGLRGKVGYLPEVPAFYSWMSGREFLAYSGELHGLNSREIKSRCEELLQVVGLKDAARRKIGGYSRGMKQRLGIAQALINRPKVLFLDEPCSALDPVGRRDVLQLISRLKADSTVFMSTHILSDVEKVCDTVAIVDKGKLITESGVDELRQKYARSAFEIEIDEDATPFVNRLKTLPWLAKVELITENSSHIIRIQASDVAKAKTELPKIISESGVTLLRYQLTLPSLEDIFVELVGKR